MTAMECATIRRCACGVPISRASKGSCVRCGYIGLKRGCPDGFADILRRFGSLSAARYYRASLSTVTRWRREIGLTAHERVCMRDRRVYSARAVTHPSPPTNRDMSEAGLAADYLRRFGSVYRCDETGKPMTNGKHWRRNLSTLTDDEIVVRARRLGWEGVD